MIDEVLGQLAHSPWALPAVFALVLGDAFLVVVPGEAAVTAAGALSVSEGSPPLAAVIAAAALAAMIGDLCCYLIGRRVGLERWRWMRRPRVRDAIAWARDSLDRRTVTAVFAARFIPFARLAVNLTAGASRVPLRRYLAAVACAATAWAAYQAVVGAAVGALVPGGPLVAVAVAIAAALAVGVGVDAIRAAHRRARR